MPQTVTYTGFDWYDPMVVMDVKTKMDMQTRTVGSFSAGVMDVMLKGSGKEEGRNVGIALDAFVI